MSDISPETGPAPIIGRKLSPEEEAEWREALEDARSDNSGGFARPSRVNPRSPARHNSKTVPTTERPETERDAYSEADPLALEHAQIAIRAIKSGVPLSRLRVPRETLENADVNEEGDVVPPDVIEADKDEDHDGGYYEADYRDLARQEAEGTDDINDDEDDLRHSSNKTFLPADDEIGLLGGVEDGEGDVKPDYSDPINGSRAA